MEDRKSKTSANELEVAQVVRVDRGGSVYLQSIVVVCGVLEETVGWIKHLMREQEEEFSVLKSVSAATCIDTI